jgi:hypothetical protein
MCPIKNECLKASYHCRHSEWCAKKAAGFFNRSRSPILEKKHAAPSRRCCRLEAEAGSQGNDAAGKTTGDCAEIGAANVIGDLVGIKV